MKKVLLIVIAVALGAIVAAYFHFRSHRTDEARALRISCANNLKQISLALRVWEGDSGDRFPWLVSTNEGGTKELCSLDKDGFDANTFRHFQVMSNEIGSPLVLICPNDHSDRPANNFANLAASNVSYRVHVVAGMTNEYSPGASNTPLVVCPADGSILYYDGSVKSTEMGSVGRRPMTVQ